MHECENNVSENNLNVNAENQIKRRNLTLGIDITNLRGGGGVTHIVELLTVAEPKNLILKK